MRIVIDLQGAQGSSRYQGIGRYLLALVTTMIRQRGHHEVILALNGYFQDSVEFLRQHFAQELPPENIRVWSSSRNTAYFGEAHVWERQAAELLREAFIASLKPDIVLVGSLFEGAGDSVTTSIGRLQTNIPTAVIFYDLIPLIYPGQYLDNPPVRAWYERKLEDLRRADYLLAISESSQQEALTHLNWDPQRISNMSAAMDSQFFKPVNHSAEPASAWRSRNNITREFVFHTGAGDARKNIEGLIRSYALLPKDLRDQHQLVIVCAHDVKRADYMRLAHEHGMEQDELVFLGYVTDADLLILYNLCKLFVFPSWHEGFGLPVLEAMSCGRAVIASNVSSLPEVVGRPDALFDPYDDRAISAKIEEVLVNTSLRLDLEKYGLERSKNFSWEISAQKALSGLEDFWAQIQNSRAQVPAREKKPLLFVMTWCAPSSDLYTSTVQALREHYTVEILRSEAASHSPSSFCENVAQKLRAAPDARVIYILPLAEDLPALLTALLQEFAGVLLFSSPENPSGNHTQFHSATDIEEALKDVYYVQGYMGLQQSSSQGAGRLPSPLTARTRETFDLASGVIALNADILNTAEIYYGKGSVSHWECLDVASPEVGSFSQKTPLAPANFAVRLSSLFESYWQNGTPAHMRVIRKLQSQGCAAPQDDVVMTIAQDITWSLGPKPHLKQLFVDISELVNRDAKTGIQRVVRSILRELLLHPPDGYRVEPIFANSRGTYGYARRFTLDFLGLDDLRLQDEEVDFFAGDILLHLDLSHQTLIERDVFHQKIRNMGVKMGVVVYDLLPVSMPWAFPEELYCIHDRWLRTICEANAVYCISQSVANEFEEWLTQERPDRIGKIEISYFHLGADIAASVPTTGLPSDSHSTLLKLKGTPSFVLVGTVEPRKGHRQTLEAFEQLWSQGVAANLVIVGKAGWNVAELVQDLRSHPRLGSQLFLLSGISDEYLALIYGACCCLLAPSEGEGFGLPLIEAAHYKLPIIARDLPVFREVAGDSAQYFSGLSPHALAQSIIQWLDSSKHRGKTLADTFGCLSWWDSAGQLLKIMGLEEKSVTTSDNR